MRKGRRNHHLHFSPKDFHKEKNSNNGNFNNTKNNTFNNSNNNNIESKKTNENFDNDNESNNNNSNDNSDVEVEVEEEWMDPLKAIKLVPKSVFWSRVTAGQERADTLVREVLAQFIVCQPIKHAVSLPLSLPLSRSKNGSLNGDKNTTSPQPILCSTSTSTSTAISPSLSPPPLPFPFNPPAVPIVQIFGAYETVDCFALELELMQPTGKLPLPTFLSPFLSISSSFLSFLSLLLSLPLFLPSLSSPPTTRTHCTSHKHPHTHIHTLNTHTHHIMCTIIINNSLVNSMIKHFTSTNHFSDLFDKLSRDGVFTEKQTQQVILTFSVFLFVFFMEDNC